jgi:hypothetical protein
MRSVLLAALLGLSAVAGCLGNESATPSAKAPDPPRATGNDGEACLYFIIVDEELQPIPNASVAVDEIKLVASTNAAGEASVCNIPHGSYHVAAKAAGYDTARKTVTYPSPEPVRFSLRLLPVLVPYHEVIPKSLFYTVGLSTLDSTISRFASLSEIACSPCAFELRSPSMPEFVYWEAAWTRSAGVIPYEDQMHHVFRGGAPFENAPGDTSNRDIGTGAMIQPFQFQYHRNDMVRSAPVKAADEAGGEVAFSGAMYCWGNPPSPCVNQRIDLFLTLWFNILKVPDDYSALPS